MAAPGKVGSKPPSIDQTLAKMDANQAKWLAINQEIKNKENGFQTALAAVRAQGVK